MQKEQIKKTKKSLKLIIKINGSHYYKRRKVKMTNQALKLQ